MKKYILSLFALLMLLTPVIGLSANELSANELTDPGTVDGEKQSPLYRLFYKEHRISSNDSIAYEDSDGTSYSFNDIFDGSEADRNYDSISDNLSVENDVITTNSDFELSSFEEMYRLDPVTDSNSDYYTAFVHTQDVEWYYRLRDIYTTDNDINTDSSSGDDVIIFSSIEEYNPSDNNIRVGIRDGGEKDTFETDDEIEIEYSGRVDISEFETSPSKSSMDTYLDVYLTVEEGETYYYYTFDGGFISILWVAVLFSGSYLYIRKAEVEDTKQAMVQASIFFIIGLVLLRVIQTVI